MVRCSCIDVCKLMQAGHTFMGIPYVETYRLRYMDVLSAHQLPNANCPTVHSCFYDLIGMFQEFFSCFFLCLLTAHLTALSTTLALSRHAGRSRLLEHGGS